MSADRLALLRQRARRLDRAAGKPSFVGKEEARAIRLELLTGKTIPEVAEAHGLTARRVASMAVQVRVGLEDRKRSAVTFPRVSRMRTCPYCKREFDARQQATKTYCTLQCWGMSQRGVKRPRHEGSPQSVQDEIAAPGSIESVKSGGWEEENGDAA